MEQQGVSGVPSANQQDGSRQSASTAHQQTDPSVTLETLKAIMKRVAVEAIEESQRRTPASSLPPTTTTGLVGVEPAMDQVPQLPVQGEQQRGGSGLPGLAEGAVATLQTVGQLLAGGKKEGSNWWWPQGEAVGSRPSYVSVGNGFPPLTKRLVERIQALEFVDMADLRPAQWQEVLDPEPDPRRYVILPGLEVARAKKKPASGGYPYMVHACASRFILPRSHREYEEPAWREYDVRFRQLAAVSGNKAWAQLDPQLYNQCIVGRARRVASSPQPGEASAGITKPARAEREGKAKSEVCFRFNREGSCPYNSQCRFQHKCSLCGGRHPSAQCKKGVSK
ncbi:hypothetical protein EMCRGX_G011621 [Ephydatia muelleri]